MTVEYDGSNYKEYVADQLATWKRYMKMALDIKKDEQETDRL